MNCSAFGIVSLEYDEGIGDILYYLTFTQYLFSQNLNTIIDNCVSNCQEYSLKWINKTAGFVKCFLVKLPQEQIVSFGAHKG
jgi:hypothetical protein